MPKNFRDFMKDDAFIMYTFPIACKSFRIPVSVTYAFNLTATQNLTYLNSKTL